MRSITGFVIVASVLALAGLGFSTAQAADQKQAADQRKAADQKQTADQKQGQSQETWRYTFHNSEWWYWLPTNRWVYWRNSRWNDYDPQTYTWPNSSLGPLAGGNGRANGNRAATDSENRPFYGHAVSDWDRRPLEANGEVGPFYGHALPSEVFGAWRARRANRPFYGHAVSSGGD